MSNSPAPTQAPRTEAPLAELIPTEVPRAAVQQTEKS